MCSGAEVEERVFATITERLPLVTTQPATQEKYVSIAPLCDYMSPWELEAIKDGMNHFYTDS